MSVLREMQCKHRETSKIYILGGHICNLILDHVGRAQWFIVIADEVTDTLVGSCFR